MSKIVLSIPEKVTLDTLYKHVSDIRENVNTLRESIADKTPIEPPYTQLTSPEADSVFLQMRMILVSLEDIQRYLDTIHRNTI